MAILRIKNLTKVFKFSLKQRMKNKDGRKSLVAVNNISFTLKPGVIYGLLGPNGAGKTTTLRTIATLIKPTSGNVYYDDKDINSNVYEYRKKIGFLTSELKLDGYFTPYQTFEYMSKLYGMSDEEINYQRNLLFASFGIDEFKDKLIKDLSTGMKQKVSLAVSLCHKPDIIIFDEPTNGLDVVAAKVVEDYLRELKKENKIVLVSTHIFSLVEKLCDEVGIIINGNLVLDSPLSELQKEGSLEDVFFRLYEEVNK